MPGSAPCRSRRPLPRSPPTAPRGPRGRRGSVRARRDRSPRACPERGDPWSRMRAGGGEMEATEVAPIRRKKLIRGMPGRRRRAEDTPPCPVLGSRSGPPRLAAVPSRTSSFGTLALGERCSPFKERSTSSAPLCASGQSLGRGLGRSFVFRRRRPTGPRREARWVRRVITAKARFRAGPARGGASRPRRLAERGPRAHAVSGGRGPGGGGRGEGERTGAGAAGEETGAGGPPRRGGPPARSFEGRPAER